MPGYCLVSKLDDSVHVLIYYEKTLCGFWRARRRGAAEKVDGKIGNVDTENNLSKKTHEFSLY